LHLWIGFACGLGPSLGVGGAGLLFGALSFTTLGNVYWQYIPWGWTARFSIIPGAYHFYQLVPPVAKVVLLAATFLFVVVMGGILWFDQWEGRELPD
jgi:ABC-2 type transport system permease protein